MTDSRYCAFPGKLEYACTALGISEDEAKIKDGRRLIKLFCEPADPGGKMTLFGVTEPFFLDWTRRPDDWELFKNYVKHDILSMRSVLRKLWNFRLPDGEMENWRMDQRINERGMPVDMTMVESAVKLTERAKAELGQRFKALTELQNPNSTAQLLPWAQENGYPYNSLGKRWVNAALADSAINDKCREAFSLRQQLSKTSVEKYPVIRDLTCNGRLTNQFVFMGASSTGRWSSAGGSQRGAQLQNLPRPPKNVEKEHDLAVNLVRKGDYEGIEMMFGSVLDTVSGTLRGTFRAPEGKIFVVCDLSAIENRVAGWEADCEKMLSVFKTCEECGGEFRNGNCISCGSEKHLDPYKSFGVHWLKKPYSEISKSERNLCKPPTLGCSYLLGAGEETVDKNGDTIRTGLAGYAQNMGIEMTFEQTAEAVKIFRETYTEVTKLWRLLMEAATTAIRNAKSATAGKCTYYVKNEMLCVHLPSGRDLHYFKPTVRKEKDDKYERIFYQKFSGKTGLALESQYSPSRAIENNTQAMARDLLVHGMRRAESEGLEIVGTVHDEILSLTDKNNAQKGLETLRRCMIQQPSWCKDLPLGAEGFFSHTYRKG
jgi:DNA polymerase